MEPTDLLNNDRIFNIIINDSLLYLYKIEKNLEKYKPEDSTKFRQIIVDLMKLSKKMSDLDYKSKGTCDFDRNYSKILLKRNEIDLWK